ncbi:MAG: hypothetical protein ACE5EX_02130 [Phycisphaerae bacterium]
MEFREFGVRLNFTPVVRGGQRIRLRVAPEVSELDLTNAAQFQGFVIPGLTSRSTETTVELGNGETIAVAGLLEAARRQGAGGRVRGAHRHAERGEPDPRRKDLHDSRRHADGPEDGYAAHGRPSARAAAEGGRGPAGRPRQGGGQGHDHARDQAAAPAGSRAPAGTGRGRRRRHPRRGVTPAVGAEA